MSGSNASKFAIGKHSFTNGVRDANITRIHSQDGKSVSLSQTSHEDSSWETQSISKVNRLDDAIARNRHTDIMSTLKGIESVLTQMSESLMKMALAMELWPEREAM